MLYAQTARIWSRLLAQRVEFVSGKGGFFAAVAFGKTVVFALVMSLVLTVTLAGQALAEKGAPKPHVSPALGAVLLPVTPTVRKQFKLGKNAAGAVVVSVDPGGVGEMYGLEPGDVITKLNDKFIRRPVDIDTMVKYQLGQDTNFFFFEGTRKGRKKKTILFIENSDYARPVDLENVSRWRGYNGGGSKSRGKRGKGRLGSDGYFYTDGWFYYADFCDGYSADFYEVYDYTLVYVDQIIVTEVYISAYESTETVFYYDDSAAGYDYAYDDYYVAEVDEYVYSEEFFSEYSSTEVVYEDEIMAQEAESEAEDGFVEDGSGETGVDEGAVDDAGASGEDFVGEEPIEGDQAVDGYAEEPVADDQYVEEPMADDQYVEEPVADEQYVEEPAPEEYVEEPVYEEPAPEEYVEEPVYEEPAQEQYVEEPVYEDNSGGGDCGTDEDGNPLC